MDVKPQLRLDRTQAENVVARFEQDGTKSVTSDEVQLLERFFLLEGDEAKDLSIRYENALKKHGA